MPNCSSPTKRPHDLYQLTLAIADEATRDPYEDEQIAESEVSEVALEKPEKKPTTVELGRRGELKGGKARAEKLTPAQRREIAKKAARKRWGTSSDNGKATKYYFVG